VSCLVAPLAATFESIHPSWRPIVDAWSSSAAGRSLIAQIDRRLAAGAIVYPARPLRALELTAVESVRVVIVGQDPYHGAGQAEGLAFSVPDGVLVPPSLRNILAELARDLDVPRAPCGHLGNWARQGVLLLNTILTVEGGKAASHAKLGWEALTDMLLRTVAETPPAKVFMLWGAHARSKAALVEAADLRHLQLCCNHPSPLSVSRPPEPFAGCGHFRRANDFLREQGAPPIDWALG
jgi:uracil-DNA glycosylase